MSVGVVVVAAGRGLRAGGPVPKQYRALAGRLVVTRTLQAFLDHPAVTCLQPVIHPDDAATFAQALAPLRADERLATPAFGGDTRQSSVLAGLEALSGGEPPALVLVHDAARPFLSAELIDRAVAAARESGAAVPGIGVADTITRIDARGTLVETPARESLRAIQTPQAFGFNLLLAAHRRARAEGANGFTDDGALVAWAGAPVMVFPGEPSNVKLTRDQDFIDAELRLTGASTTRVGSGFDVHAFAAGDHIWLGGVRIPHDRGVLAHSDGDVALHALTDALLGALADGDIGMHFPPSDPRWRGASSDLFLRKAVERVARRSGTIDHLDITVLCETPKVGPYREAMRARIAEIVGVPLGSVSIKATTTERLGFTGRGEGIAAQATATVRLPRDV